MLRTRFKQNGFTIVELLIVIVVIGILAMIVLNSFIGSQNRANNAARLNELKAWHKVFETYRAQTGNYPAGVSGTGYCLGPIFPNNKCRDYQSSGATSYNVSDSVAMNNTLRTVGALPDGKHIPVNGTVGPYVTYTDTYSWTMTNVFNGYTGECPTGTTETWNDGAGRLLCVIFSSSY